VPDRVFVWNDIQRDEAVELHGVPRERVVVQHNGVDGERFALREREPARARLGLPSDRRLVLYVGNLQAYQGIDLLLAAFARALREVPEARLLIVGKGPYEDELRRQAGELGVNGRLEITSVPSDDPAGMAKLLGQVSLVVLMSEFETHPLVALEAAAARRRLLVADAGGLAELAGDGFGRAIPLDSTAEQIAAAAVEELDRPLPERSPDLASWDECAAALLDLYGSILRSGRLSERTTGG